MKTNIKNKALLLATLFLGLQPFAVLSMHHEREEIVIREIKDNGEETIIPFEDQKNQSSSWIPSFSLSSLGNMATQAVNRMIINPINTFVDSSNGFIVPGITLAGDNAYGKIFGNRSYNLTRTSARYLAYITLGYKIFRMQSMLSQIQQGVVNIQNTQTEHTQKLNTIDKTTVQLDKNLKVVNKEVVATKLNTEDIKKQTIDIQECIKKLNEWAEKLNVKTNDISQTMSTKDQVEIIEKNIDQRFTDFNIKMDKVETTGNKTSQDTNTLTDMFTQFMQRSQTDSQNLKKVLEDTSDIKTFNKESREHQEKQNNSMEQSLKQQYEILQQQERMFKDIVTVLNIHKNLGILPSRKNK